MDILRKELNEIYASQCLDKERLDRDSLNEFRKVVDAMARIDNSCCVITDIADDVCYVYGGALATLMGWSEGNPFYCRIGSSDEDFIYNRLNPEDLPDKRLLEYEFFKYADALPAADKLNAKATCRIRIKDKADKYIWIDNSTQVLCTSPEGKMWLILCQYKLSSDQTHVNGITPCIIDYATSAISGLSFQERRTHLLSQREKEILNLIKAGKSSKMIADMLNISKNTVDRHRQNILDKLSVANSFEAINAADAMNLL